MAPSPITRSASEQLALAQTKEFKFLQLVELLKLDYEMYHNQIHLFDERIRQGSSATPPLQQPLMAWLEHERACAAFNLGHRRGKWTEYLGKIKVVKSRIKELERLVAAEQRAADEEAMDNEKGKEEAAVKEEVEEGDQNNNVVADEATAEVTVVDDAVSESAAAR